MQEHILLHIVSLIEHYYPDSAAAHQNNLPLSPAAHSTAAGASQFPAAHSTAAAEAFRFPAAHNTARNSFLLPVGNYLQDLPVKQAASFSAAVQAAPFRA